MSLSKIMILIIKNIQQIYQNTHNTYILIMHTIYTKKSKIQKTNEKKNYNYN